VLCSKPNCCRESPHCTSDAHLFITVIHCGGLNRELPEAYLEVSRLTIYHRFTLLKECNFLHHMHTVMSCSNAQRPSHVTLCASQCVPGICGGLCCTCRQCCCSDNRTLRTTTRDEPVCQRADGNSASFYHHDSACNQDLITGCKRIQKITRGCHQIQHWHITARAKRAYLLVLHAWLNCHLQCLRLASILYIATLLAFLSLELLEHAGPKLLCDHLVLAIALTLALCWLDDILISGHLHEHYASYKQTRIRAQ